MYAIVEIGGKQYKVEKDMVLNVDRTLQGKTDKLAIEKVLMLVDGEKMMVGRPYLSNVRVSAAILKEDTGKRSAGSPSRRKNYNPHHGISPALPPGEDPVDLASVGMWFGLFWRAALPFREPGRTALRSCC